MKSKRQLSPLILILRKSFPFINVCRMPVFHLCPQQNDQFECTSTCSLIFNRTRCQCVHMKRENELEKHLIIGWWQIFASVSIVHRWDRVRLDSNQIKSNLIRNKLCEHYMQFILLLLLFAYFIITVGLRVAVAWQINWYEATNITISNMSEFKTELNSKQMEHMEQMNVKTNTNENIHCIMIIEQFSS